FQLDFLHKRATSCRSRSACSAVTSHGVPRTRARLAALLHAERQKQLVHVPSAPDEKDNSPNAVSSGRSSGLKEAARLASTTGTPKHRCTTWARCTPPSTTNPPT